MTAIRITARIHELGGMSVGRVLPERRCRAVGPFVFLDHMGPDEGSVQVAPHPHIGLSTLTWLFEGEVRHRDSLGNDQWIRPGDVNWMTAGHGIVHSERGPHGPLHGLQCWVAQTRQKERADPSFQHLNASELPRFSREGIAWTVIAGQWLGYDSPLVTDWPTVFVEGRVAASGEWQWSYPAGWALALYLVSGELRLTLRTGERIHLQPGELCVVPEESDETASAPMLQAVSGSEGTHFACLGGEPLPEPRYFDWNFVASDREILSGARQDWILGRFPPVPGDDGRIPHPAEQA